MVWVNPQTGEKAFQVHGICAQKLFIRQDTNSEIEVIDNVVNIRSFLHNIQSRIHKPEYILMGPVEEGDMVIWDSECDGLKPVPCACFTNPCVRLCVVPLRRGLPGMDGLENPSSSEHWSKQRSHRPRPNAQSDVTLIVASLSEHSPRLASTLLDGPEHQIVFLIAVTIEVSTQVIVLVISMVEIVVASLAVAVIMSYCFSSCLLTSYQAEKYMKLLLSLYNGAPEVADFFRHCSQLSRYWYRLRTKY